MIEQTITLSDPNRALALFGPRDQYLRALRDAFGVTISHRDGQLRIQGEEAAVTKAAGVFDQFAMVLKEKNELDPETVNGIVGAASGKGLGIVAQPIDIINIAKRITPRTAGQARYVDSIRQHDITFAIGPAGTGKTYLAVALAVEALKNHKMRKIVLVRPAVEAGESLGYLPGDMFAKINPYLRPLLDALQEMINYDQMKQYM